MPTSSRTPVLACICVLLAAPASAQQAPQIHMPDSTPPRTVRLTSAVEAPLVASGIPGAQLPVVEVRINGRGPYRFGIETGAGFVAMRRSLADSLGLTRSGGPDEYPEYHVDSLSIGAAVFGDFIISGMPRGPTGADGILGLSLFKNVLLTIDYPRSVASFVADTLPAADGKNILALTRVGPFWGVPLVVAGRATPAVLDTRSTGAIGVTPEFAAQLPFDGALTVIGRASGAAIAEREVRAGRLAGDVTVGRYTVPRPMLSVRSLPPGFPEEPLVGSVLLRNFAITLDQRHGRLRLAREGPATIELPEPRVPSTAATAPAAPSSELAFYVGHYGDRTLSIVDGKLHLQRPGGPLLELVPTAPDRFDIRGIPEAKIEFVRDGNGRVTSMRVLVNGEWQTAARTGGG
jgi:hypothetical protein